MTIAYHLQQVLQRIAESVNKFPGANDKVRLVAVSKTRPAEAIRTAFDCGQKDFGENYLQEAIDKIEQLNDLDICWHFIGPIQSNKTAGIAEHFDWCQSVDRVKIARRLSNQRPEHMTPLNICIQVNISAEQSKSGVSPDEVLRLAREIATLPNLCLRGLMAIPSKTTDPEQQRKAFANLRDCFHQLQANYASVDTLSMGMSGDLESAIAEGSTMVRIGTDIFGPRT